MFINGTQDVFCEEVGEFWSNTYHVCEFEISGALNFNLITEIYESELRGYLTHNVGIYLPKFFP